MSERLSTSNTLTRAVYPRGVRRGTEVSIPLNADRVKLRIPFASWPRTAADVLEARIEISMDGGTTWRPFLGWTVPGIPARDPLGNEVTETWGRVGVPEPSNPNRMMRAYVDSNRTLTLEVTMEAGIGDF